MIGDEKMTEALVYPKKSLFSKVHILLKMMKLLNVILQNLQVKTCSNKELGGCIASQVPNSLKSKLDNCNFEGRLKEDYSSKFHFMNCDNEMQDISVISSKVLIIQHIINSFINLFLKKI